MFAEGLGVGTHSPPGTGGYVTGLYERIFSAIESRVISRPMSELATVYLCEIR